LRYGLTPTAQAPGRFHHRFQGPPTLPDNPSGIPLSFQTLQLTVMRSHGPAIPPVIGVTFSHLFSFRDEIAQQLFGDHADTSLSYWSIHSLQRRFNSCAYSES
jgi:hypothetical protein